MKNLNNDLLVFLTIIIFEKNYISNIMFIKTIKYLIN